MATRPLPSLGPPRAALLAAGATLVAGHSAHVFHGVEGPVLYDLGDFIDDYAVDPRLRNDLGLLWLVTLDEQGPPGSRRSRSGSTSATPGSPPATTPPGSERRFRAACADFDTAVERDGERLVVPLRR